MKKDISSKNHNLITYTLSSLAIVISCLSLYLSFQPEETKLTIKSSPLEPCLNDGKLCHKLFIYNNDNAPCFDFKLNFDKNNFDKVLLLKNFEKVNVFNANYDGTSIFFEALKPIPIVDEWLGYLDKNQIAYLALYPKNIKAKTEFEISITCVDYKKIIFLK